MPRRLPPDEELLSLLSEAMRLYEAALPDATPTQLLVWRWIDRTKFIEQAAKPWGFDSETHLVVISIAMKCCVEGLGLVSPEAALKYAKRRAATTT
jgi:hypothetical protein